MVNVAHNDGRRMKRRFLFGIGSFTPRNEGRTYQHQKQEGDRKGRDGSSGISIARDHSGSEMRIRPGSFSGDCATLDLPGIFRVGLTYGHVWVLGRIRRFLDGKGLRLRRNSQSIFRKRIGMWPHDILMPETAERKPSIAALCCGGGIL
jgi:hypothetical protein